MVLTVEMDESFPELPTVVDVDRDLDMALESSVEGERLFSFMRLAEVGDIWDWAAACLLCFRDAVRALEIDERE